MGSPDAKELELISQLRLKVSDLNMKEKFNSDHYLLRWIRARQLNLELAEKMLRDHIKWREEHDVDNILSWTPPETVVVECPMEFLGFDNDNSPVQLFPFGKWDMKKIVDMGERENFLKYMCQISETMLMKMDGKVTRSGYPVTQFVVIVDQKGLSYRHLTSIRAVMDLNMTLTRRFEANYPETVKTVFEINCNAVFAALFALCKPLLSQDTIDKVRIFSTDEAKWKAALLATMPASILPPHLGGTCQTCKLSPTPPKKETGEENPFIQVQVPAGDKLDICFVVDEGNSTIKYAFKTEAHDIAFAVNCNGKSYVEKTRVSSHLEVQEGTITCETPGDYIFTFDNVYSRWRAKAVWYKVDILPPNEQNHASF